MDLFVPRNGYHIDRVCRQDCAPFILGIHYAKCWPSVSYAWGLYLNGDLQGVVTFGVPSSAPLRSGIAGDEFALSVLELNRLVLKDNRKNEASRLVGFALREIGKTIGDKIIVSFADPQYGHVGYVYQACNFLYTGLSAKRTDWTIRGREHLHGQTIADEFRGVKNRSEAMRGKYGDDFYLRERPRKHRYIYLVGRKSFKKRAIQELRYEIEPYPKVDIDATA